MSSELFRNITIWRTKRVLHIQTVNLACGLEECITWIDHQVKGEQRLTWWDLKLYRVLAEPQHNAIPLDSGENVYIDHARPMEDQFGSCTPPATR